jgi:hypothetical protein
VTAETDKAAATPLLLDLNLANSEEHLHRLRLHQIAFAVAAGEHVLILGN